MKLIDLMIRGYAPVYEGEDEGAGGGGDDKGGDEKAGDDEGGDDKTGDDKAQRPDWLNEKYKTVEDQAKAYTEAAQKLTQKTEDMRAEVLEEAKAAAKAELAAESGVPDEATGYEYPEGVVAPEDTAVDEAFRAMAKEHGISQEGFAALSQMYAKISTVDLEAEKIKLGDKADERLDRMRRWGEKNIPVEMQGAAESVMRTAEGVQLIEHLASLAAGDALKLMPVTPSEPSGGYTRDQLREMMRDERYQNPRKREDAFVKMVDEGYRKLHGR